MAQLSCPRPGRFLMVSRGRCTWSRWTSSVLELSDAQYDWKCSTILYIQTQAQLSVTLSFPGPDVSFWISTCRTQTKDGHLDVSKSQVQGLEISPVCICVCWVMPLLSMKIFRQEHWCGLPFPPQGDLPNPWMKPTSLASPALAGGFFTTGATWEAWNKSRASPEDRWTKGRSERGGWKEGREGRRGREKEENNHVS